MARIPKTSRGKGSNRNKWFIKEVSDKIALTVKQRVAIATDLVRSKVVKNLSIPVVRRGNVVIIRSKPGEYPRADTVQLMRTIFGIKKETSPQVFDGFIGTNLDYGLFLETRMNRSFLRRTLNEERSKVMRILTGPIK